LDSWLHNCGGELIGKLLCDFYKIIRKYANYIRKAAGHLRKIVEGTKSFGHSYKTIEKDSIPPPSIFGLGHVRHFRRLISIFFRKNKIIGTSLGWAFINSCLASFGRAQVYACFMFSSIVTIVFV